MSETLICATCGRKNDNKEHWINGVEGPRCLECNMRKNEQNARAAIPVADFKRFQELIDIVAHIDLPEYERMEALEELAGDLANVEVLSRLVYEHAPVVSMRETYDSVWKDGQ